MIHAASRLTPVVVGAAASGLSLLLAFPSSSVVPLVLPEVSLDSAIFNTNRNARNPKAANHGARPCSNRRRRRMKRLRRTPG
jgi:hypothetical protein